VLIFRTEGTSRERGREQGYRCSKLAVPYLEGLIARLNETPGIDSVRIARNTAVLTERVNSAYPELIDECRGIAEGLAWSSQKYFTAIFSTAIPELQCTILAFRDLEGNPILGKTDDLYEHEIGGNVLEITTPDRGYRYVHFHYAGSVWSVAGMNERGLSMGMTGILGPRIEDIGAPSLMALHPILPECGDVGEAVDYIRESSVISGGFSLLLADRNGSIALVEKTGVGTAVLDETNGCLYHTNHILDHDFAKINPPQAKELQINGEGRLERVKSRIGSIERTKRGMTMLFSERSGAGAIQQSGQDGLITDFTLIMKPVELGFTFWTTGQDPADGENVRLDELFS
jgi:hypothetical protein